MKKQKGITLIALAITMIVLLVLAGITITTIMENNGVIKKGQETVEDWKEAEAADQEILDTLYDEKEKSSSAIGVGEKPKILIADKFRNDNTGEIKIGDYVKYTPTKVTVTNTSPIIQNLATYSGYVGTAYNKVDSTNKIKQEDLKWRVWDKTLNGEIRLISEVPTESRIALTGAKGYNNLVKLIDDFCKELYSNTNLTSKVQNLKIEDIEGKMTTTALNTVHKSPYKTYPQAACTYEKSYPKIWEQEIGAKINDVVQNGKLKTSEQQNYIGEAAVTATTSITGYQTSWYKGLVATDWKNLKYQELYSYYDCLLSSRSVYAGMGEVVFGVQYVDGSYVNSMDIFYSGGGGGGTMQGYLRPVVTLNSNVKVTGGNGAVNNGWEIE